MPLVYFEFLCNMYLPGPRKTDICFLSKDP